MSNFSLFNAVDDGLLNYFSDEAFEDSLLMNILFQDQVFVDEASVFNSTLLERHVGRSHLKKNTSLFEQAASAGLILPYSLDGTVQSMEEARERLVKRYGPRYEFSLGDPLIKSFVTGALDIGLKATPVRLPPPEKNFGEEYLRQLQLRLQRTDPPREGDERDDSLTFRELHLASVWGPTARWRFETIEMAAKRTREKGHPGVQRAELFNALGWELGVPREKKTVRLNDILGAVRGTSSSIAAEAFLRWITQIHQLTRAKLARAEASLPVCQDEDALIIDSLPTSTTSRFKRIKFQIPARTWAFEEGVAHILRTRYEQGESVRAAIADFARDPTENNEGILDQRVADYGKGLRKCYKQPSFPFYQMVTQTVGVTSSAIGAYLAVHGTSGFSSDLRAVGSVAGLATSLKNLGETGFGYVKKRFETRPHEILHELVIPPSAVLQALDRPASR